MGAKNNIASVYSAHPLKSGSSTNIRLLELLPSNSPYPNTPIFCRLHVVPLDKTPFYTALSYVWGNEPTTKTIILDGRPFAIRLNLWNFLAQYKRYGAGQFIWIDAICINQLCDDERSHQVAMMGCIYSRANPVIAWLGPELWRPLGALVQHTEPSSDHHFIATNLKPISASEYWKRLWIVQEFVLGERLEIWSGASRMSGDTLSKLFKTMCECFQQRRFSRDEVRDVQLRRMLMSLCGSPARHIVDCRSARNNYSSKRLFQKFGQQKCRDVRDRVYGLLGLINAQELTDYPIHPDYSKSTSDLFVDIWDRQYAQAARDWHRGSSWKGLEAYAERLQSQLDLNRKDAGVKLVFERIANGKQDEKYQREAKENADAMSTTMSNVTSNAPSNTDSNPKSIASSTSKSKPKRKNVTRKNKTAHEVRNVPLATWQILDDRRY